MSSCPRIRRSARLALIFISLATASGAGTVLGHSNETEDSISARASTALLSSARIEGGATGRAHKPGDCRNLDASFLDSGCHAMELSGRHPGHSAHRVAIVLIEHADAPEPETE